jgi:aminoglycoside phosphotransferase family enzyme/predicted kinase
MPFLDFSTFEMREQACRNEVRINRRLAPKTYQGVVPVRRRSDGHYTFNSSGAIVDWAVRMTRLDEAQRADTLLARGALTPAHIDAIATKVAAFHASSPSTPRIAWFGAPERVLRNVVDNFRSLRESIGSEEDLVTSDAIAEVERWQGAFLRGHRDLFERRMIEGAVRDGHGDLRLEHVFFHEHEAESAFEVIDGIEFDDRYRLADVCADVAFLAMDLARLGRVDLAERFIATYARTANDFDLYRLIDFYESYRACVRAKIAASIAVDPSVSPEAAVGARAEARRYLILAQSARRPAVLPPMLIAMAGGIAAGKSTLAERLGEELSAPVVDADRTRKHMIGMRPTMHATSGAWEGAYEPALSVEVYAEVLRRADAVLASGRPVIVDASFRTRAARRAARELASSHNVPLRMFECVAPEERCRARLEARRPSESVSDATPGVLHAFIEGYEPIRELPPTEHIPIPTDGPVGRAFAQIEQEIATWPRGLVG